jgi:hypothetical protein
MREIDAPLASSGGPRDSSTPTTCGGSVVISQTNARIDLGGA